MTLLDRELVFLILQYLNEANEGKYKDTVHRLEKDSGYFFNMRYFEDCVNNGEWDEADSYLSGFCKVDESRYSTKIFFEIRKQKYFEALDRHDYARAVEILQKDLKVFSTINEERFKEMTLLLSLGNFRENEELSDYGDIKSARAVILTEVKKIIEASPLFRDKLQFPKLKNSRLSTLINQGLNWQHHLCNNPRPNADFKTLFSDHSCGHIACAPSPAINPIMGSIAKVRGSRKKKVGGFPPIRAHGPCQPAPAPLTTSLSGWTANPSSVPHQTVSARPRGLTVPNNACMIAFDFSHADTLHSSEDLPKTVIFSLSQGSAVKSMDFHPVQQTLLLVGTNIGNITIWEFIFSTAIDGKIKAWLYDNLGSRVDYHAPGHSFTRIVYSTDGTRLFSCGTNKEGESYIVEWDETQGAVKRTYNGLGKRTLGVVQFDTTKNRFLAAGDEFQIKFWDMDNVNLLNATNAEGGLPNGDARSLDKNSRVAEELEKPKTWKLTEVNEPSLLRSIRLPDALNLIVRLIYANSGGSILALTHTGVHRLWKWQKNEQNVLGKVWIVPWAHLVGYIILWLMIFHHFFLLPKLQTLATFMPPPPAATFVAFHPVDNNIIAVGMEDSTIHLFHVPIDTVKYKIKGHQKRVTGLAFSTVLNVLVSSGADSQLCVWSLDGWAKQAGTFLQIPTGRMLTPLAQTRVQFHQDLIHLLVVHETQIAIYEASKLECLKKWVPRQSLGPITDATYSCDSESIYASFEDASVFVLTASTLRIRCRISSAAYIPSNPSARVYPAVVAAHPSEPNQFAVGLTDGGVVVMEPPESEETWGTMPPVENAGPSAGAAAGLDQQLR
ncbi:hypothetical protein GBA52_009950 [Prunus armeniaca]|nr:hypothetical protein GBA52_009950 [Prunus armeniaca]